MFKRIVTIAVLASLACVARGGSAAAKDPAPPRAPSIQIALLLDTSNSMDGLIAQAKTQLWTVVNEFIRARRDGRPPRVEVALFEYGNNRLSPQEGFVRLVLPMTDDLDKVSEELFALTTNGGNEFCGQVIQEAVGGLSWNSSRDVYKAIFIAGNEPFTQGPVDFHVACRAAIGRGILVNTIFCGPHAEGEQTSWKDGATLADGQYMSIDQNQKVVHIPAPQDKEIVRLNTDLNATYIPYGKMGREGQARQLAQDSNADKLSPSVLAARTNVKCAAVYCPSDWDLVDAIKTGKCKLDDLKDEDFPESLRSKSKVERKVILDEAAKKRGSIQAEIVKLNAERERFLAKEQAKQASKGQETLDAAIIRAIRGQARALHFTFEQTMAHHRILVIEDDPAIRRGVVDALRFAGYATLDAGEGDAALATALESECDLVLLDLVLPGRDGLTILREIREALPVLPVIILTARAAEDDRVRGLRLGADDYVIKPFSIKELLARIEAVLRSPARPSAVRTVAFTGGRADLERHEVRFDDGSRCELSERERELLRYLAAHTGRAISREEILARVWGLDPTGITTRTIDMHVARLREKLRDDPAEPRIVLTVRGRGYMLALASGGP